MKKKRKKQLKEIEKQKARLERDLKNFLEDAEKTTDEEQKNYIPLGSLRHTLSAIDLKRAEMEDVSMYAEIYPPYVKLNSTRDITIAIAILYTLINCEIYDSRREYSTIPDQLMDQITDLEDSLEKFLFS